jgi:hypothetical protein
MRRSILVVPACLVLVVHGCSEKPAKSETLEVKSVLKGTWSLAGLLEDRPDFIRFGDDGALDMALERKGIRLDELHREENLLKVAGTFTLIENNFLKLDFKVPVEEKLARKAPEPGTYRVKAERIKHKGEDKQGVRYKDWEELRLILTGRAGVSWSLHREAGKSRRAKP